MESILARRLDAQGITRADGESARDVVAWLGAVQAQDYLASKWAVGLRMQSATDADIERAVSEGSILRTHAFRFTWQYLAPEDARWILDLVGPHVIRRASSRFNELGLDSKTLGRAAEAIQKALRAGPLDRAGLGAVLRGAKVSPDERLSHVLGWMELSALITSGPRKGKQHTWALFDDRCPPAKKIPRDEALARLAERYVRSRGPATIDDFIWWTGLPAAEARTAFASVAKKTEEAFSKTKSTRAFLLPAFDEYLIAYTDRSAMIADRHRPKLDPRGGMLEPVIVLDGRVIGGWSRTLKGDSVAIDLRLFARLSKDDRRAVERAIDRYVAFLNVSRTPVRPRPASAARKHRSARRTARR